MPKVIVVQVIYNSKKWIEPVFTALFNQTFKDFKAVVVVAGNDDGGKELLMEKFPQVEIIDPGYNIGFAKGHNLVFEKYSNLSPSPRLLPEMLRITLQAGGEGRGEVECSPEFFQLVNPDLIMQADYMEKMLEVFEDEKVGAATGKLFKIEDLKLKIEDCKTLDTTGVTISKSGRARDRGQWETDLGQYDLLTDVQAVSGAGAMYRASALKAISYKLKANTEYFDSDFHSYWEDVDLAWRMVNKGWKCKFAPKAIAFHGRTAGSSKKGYLNVLAFIKHHKQLNPKIKQLNWTNHIYMYIKNSKYFYPQFFFREFFMLIYILLFEISTLKVLPDFFKTLPMMWKKRSIIKKLPEA